MFPNEFGATTKEQPRLRGSCSIYSVGRYPRTLRRLSDHRQTSDACHPALILPSLPPRIRWVLPSMAEQLEFSSSLANGLRGSASLPDSRSPMLYADCDITAVLVLRHLGLPPVPGFLRNAAGKRLNKSPKGGRLRPIHALAPAKGNLSVIGS